MTITTRLACLTAAALLWQAAGRASADDKPAPTITEKLDKILENQQDARIKAELLAQRVNTLNTELELARAKLERATGETQALRERIERLERDMTILRTNKTISQAFNPDAPPPAAPAPAPPTGRVRFQNQYRAPATFILNGRAIVVNPGETKVLPDVPAGNFTLEVKAEGYGVIRETISRVLVPNETYFMNVGAGVRRMTPAGNGDSIGLEMVDDLFEPGGKVNGCAVVR